MDEPRNGERYVTHQRLADVMDQHRREEDVRREQLADRLSRSIENRALAKDVERIGATVTDQGQLQDVHEARWQRVEGMVSLARIALGSSIISTVAAVVAIVVALR